MYFKNNKSHSKLWKAYLLFSVSTIFSIAISTILICMKQVGLIDQVSFIELNVFPIKTLNSAFSYFLEAVLPFLVLNYYLIFYKNRYQELKNKHEIKDKKWVLANVISTIWICFAINVILFFTI